MSVSLRIATFNLENFDEDPDESGAFRTDALFPESDHAPVLAEFQID